MRNTLTMFRGVGLRDGMWTVATSAGSKVQTLAIVAIAGRIGGYAGVGELLLATSIAILASVVGDLGLSTQVIRLFSTAAVRSSLQALWPMFLRASIAVPISLVLAVVVLVPKVTEGTDVAWVTAVALYAWGLVFGGVTTQIVYGQGQFRTGAIAVGSARSASTIFLLTAAILALPGWVLVLVLAAVEFIVAALQLRRSGAFSASWTRESLTPNPHFRLASTMPFTVGPIANAIVNRSDLAVIALFLSSSQLGLYGLASQIENALTTIALIPAGAAVSYAARARGSRSTLSRQRVALVTVVTAIYVTEAILLLLFLEPIINLIFGLEVVDPVPIWLCVVAGLLSCVAGIAMQQITGHGSARRAAVVWLSTLLVGLLALVLGATAGTATGVAIGALIRDTTFFALSWGAVIAMGSKGRRT